MEMIRSWVKPQPTPSSISTTFNLKSATPRLTG
jgi:hypothetical protein